MVKQNIICLAIGVLYGFTPCLSWLNYVFLAIIGDVLVHNWRYSWLKNRPYSKGFLKGSQRFARIKGNYRGYMECHVNCFCNFAD